MFNPLHIAGNDAFNDAIDKLQQQQIDERRHQDILREQREANAISAQALEEARKANQKSKRSNIIVIASAVISALSIVAAVLIGVFT